MGIDKKPKSNTAIWVIWMITLIAFFFVALGTLSGGQFVSSAIFAGLFVVDLIIFIIVISIRNKNDRVLPNNSAQNNHNESNNTPSYTPLKRALKDEVLEQFDSYISNNFSDLPLDEFKPPVERLFSFAYQEKDMQSLVNEMKKHIGIDTFAISVHFKKYPPAGKDNKTSGGSFQRTSLITAVIYINEELTTAQIPACLSHEMAHAYQSFKGKQPYADNSDLEECFTDLLTFYLGFSKFVKKGYYSNNSKLGYVHDGDFLKIEEIYSKRTSSKGSYVDEKQEFNQLIETFEQYINVIVDSCERLSKKYLPSEDKQFVLSMLEKYQSKEIKDKIEQYKKGFERRAISDLRTDTIGLEIKIEEAIKDKEKVVRIENYILNR